MRILVHADSLGERASRMALAAAGLALRGHAVVWGGRTPPPAGADAAEALERVAGGLAPARRNADVVIGGPNAVSVTLAGWLARARCLVLALDDEALRGWKRTAELAWSTLHAWAMIEEGDGSRVAQARGLDGERTGLWPAGSPPARADVTHPDTEALERLCERAVARQRGAAPRGAVFLDRDGTIVVERDHLCTPEGIELLPGAAEGLRQLQGAGWALVVISNQAGVGRGLFPLAAAHATMARLRVVLRGRGVELDGIYFCPHRPDEGCSCRKPGTRLLERAAGDHLLRLRGSVMIGDKRIDVEAGRRVGGSGVLVRTGYGRRTEAELAAEGAAVDHVCDDLGAAAAWILDRGEARS